MTKKFGLLAELDSGKPEKQKFQLFEAELGFERVQVLIPFNNVEKFIIEAESKKPKSLTILKQLVKQFGGSIE